MLPLEVKGAVAYGAEKDGRRSPSDMLMSSAKGLADITAGLESVDSSRRPDKAAYDAEQEEFKREIDGLQVKLVSSIFHRVHNSESLYKILPYSQQFEKGCLSP